MTLVKMAMMTSPVRIQKIANNRPGTPMGAISPYLWENMIKICNLVTHEIVYHHSYSKACISDSKFLVKDMNFD